MRARVVVRPEAREELSEAVSWYKSKSPVITAAFRGAIRKAILNISERPESFPEVIVGVRRALTRQFPYAIVFSQESELVVILAIKQQAQDPAAWPKGG